MTEDFPGTEGGINAGEAEPPEERRSSRIPSVKRTWRRDFAGKEGSRCNRKKQKEGLSSKSCAEVQVRVLVGGGVRFKAGEWADAWRDFAEAFAFCLAVRGESMAVWEQDK